MKVVKKYKSYTITCSWGLGTFKPQLGDGSYIIQEMEKRFTQACNKTMPKNQPNGKEKNQANLQLWFMHQDVIKNGCKELILMDLVRN